MPLFEDTVHRLIRQQRAERSPGPQASPGLRCLVVGSGGREHALAWRLLRDEPVGSVDVLPGNGGTALIARNVENVPATDPHRVAEHALHARIDLAIVGPDEAVALGVGDALRRAGIAVVSPSREASRIEWSKSFAKEVMDRSGVPTARWWCFDELAECERFLASEPERPLVVKADGLAAGKGVTVAHDRAAALAAARAALVERKFGDAGKRIVVEEVLVGQEVSLLALVDGSAVVPLPPARDYKRVGDGDEGANTGGMGAYSPTTHLPDEAASQFALWTILPIAHALIDLGTPYRGILYAGLMLTEQGPFVLELNARFGDPEAQVILPRIGGDFSALMLALAEGNLARHVAEHGVEALPQAAVDVVVAARDYPGSVTTGERIDGLLDVPEGAIVFHAGTRRVGDAVVSSGGRVVHVVGRGATVAEARAAAYAAAERIRFPSAFHRHDIALEAAPAPA